MTVMSKQIVFIPFFLSSSQGKKKNSSLDYIAIRLNSQSFTLVSDRTRNIGNVIYIDGTIYALRPRAQQLLDRWPPWL